MGKPELSELEQVLAKEDWRWSPHFRITPLKLGDIKQVIASFYSAVDKAIEAYEGSLTDPSKDQALPQRNREWEEEKQKCRDVLMTYTHGGMHKPFAIRHRRLLENLGVYGLWRSHTSLWYFAIAWQFGEWYDYVLEVYQENKQRTLQNLTKEASEQFAGGLRDSLSFHFLDKQTELLDDSLNDLANEGTEEDCHHRERFLDVWLDLRGIELESSEKDEVIGWMFNRYDI